MTYIPPSLLPGDDGPLCIPRHMVQFRELLARFGGYFWGPCPLCGFDFAGFEVGLKSVPSTRYQSEVEAYEVCCRWCDAGVRTKAETFPSSVSH